MGGNIVWTHQFVGTKEPHLDNGGVDGTIQYSYVRVGQIHVAKL
jgi:hypothetical protein